MPGWAACVCPVVAVAVVVRALSYRSPHGDMGGMVALAIALPVAVVLLAFGVLLGVSALFVCDTRAAAVVGLIANVLGLAIVVLAYLTW